MFSVVSGDGIFLETTEFRAARMIHISEVGDPVSTQVRPLNREVDVLRSTLERVERLLPSGWSLELKTGPAANRAADAGIVVAAPNGDSAALVAEVKRTIITRDLQTLVGRLRDAVRGTVTNAVPLVIARYLSPSAQTWLTEQDVSYADATGNVRILLSHPALFLRDVGASRDPWRGPGRPRGSLRGGPPAGVVRALVDFAPPFSVPRLVELSGTSTGATYRVVKFLQEEELLERSGRGPIEVVRWRQVLERWSQDYGFMTSNSVRRYLQPRGLPNLMHDLASLKGVEFAVTGSIAAQKWAPYAPPRAAMIYTDDPDTLADHLGLREVESGINVLVASPMYAVVFERTQVLDGVRVVAPSQAAVDLMTGPGRNPAEAQAVLEWMEQNVNAWRQ